MKRLPMTGGMTAALLLMSGTALAQSAPQGGTDARPELPAELLKTTPGGVTAEKVAEQAAATSYTAKAAEESLRAAGQRVDAAFTSFLPRLSLSARYTRLSEVHAAPITFGAFSVPGDSLSPPIFDTFGFVTSVVVPISDYFLRINQGYSAATSSREAAHQDVTSARAKAYADGKAAYYTWLRARGAQVVAGQALSDQKTHLGDAKNLFTVGRVSKADVLRAETAVAAAELAVERAKNLVDITERQIHVAMHLGDDATIAAGEGLEGAVAPFQGNLQQLTQEAIAARPELKSLDANIAALKNNGTATRNGALPQALIVGNLNVLNPNQRKFPVSQDTFVTWDLTFQVQWSPNDILSAGNNGAALHSQARQLEDQKQAAKDGITLEVAQAYNALKEAEFSVETSKRELTAAHEAYRVAHELFINGAATSTTLTDAETELTRARLDALNAAVDVRTAHVRLDHALGRDVKPAL